MSQIAWQFPGGQTLNFHVVSRDGPWADVPGIYMFCRPRATGTWEPVYVGQADSFKNRLCSSHHQWDAAERLGAVTVHARTVMLASERDALERMLVGHLQPQLNTQLRNPPWHGGLPGLLGRA